MTTALNNMIKSMDQAGYIVDHTEEQFHDVKELDRCFVFITGDEYDGYDVAVFHKSGDFCGKPKTADTLQQATIVFNQLCDQLAK